MVKITCFLQQTYGGERSFEGTLYLIFRLIWMCLIKTMWIIHGMMTHHRVLEVLALVFLLEIFPYIINSAPIIAVQLKLCDTLWQAI